MAYRVVAHLCALFAVIAPEMVSNPQENIYHALNLKPKFLKTNMNHAFVI